MSTEHNPSCPRPPRVAAKAVEAEKSASRSLAIAIQLQGLAWKIDEKVKEFITANGETSARVAEIVATAMDKEGCHPTVSGNPQPPAPKSGAHKIPPPPTPPSLLLVLCLCSILALGTASRQSRANDVDGLIVVASSFQGKGQHEEAAQAWANAREAGADPLVAGNEQAYNEYAVGRHAEALATLDRVFKIDRTNGRAHYIRGLIYDRLGRGTEAKESYRLALHYGEPLAARKLKRI